MSNSVVDDGNAVVDDVERKRDDSKRKRDDGEYSNTVVDDLQRRYVYLNDCLQIFKRGVIEIKEELSSIKKELRRIEEECEEERHLLNLYISQNTTDKEIYIMLEERMRRKIYTFNIIVIFYKNKVPMFKFTPGMYDIPEGGYVSLPTGTLRHVDRFGVKRFSDGDKDHQSYEVSFRDVSLKNALRFLLKLRDESY